MGGDDRDNYQDNLYEKDQDQETKSKRHDEAWNKEAFPERKERRLLNITSQNNIPILGGDEPTVITAQIVVTPEFKKQLEAWQKETGIHMFTLGTIVLSLGHAALCKILNNEDERQILDETVARLQTDGPTPEE
jgi:hypothetical protein